MSKKSAVVSRIISLGRKQDLLSCPTRRSVEYSGFAFPYAATQEVLKWDSIWCSVPPVDLMSIDRICFGVLPVRLMIQQDLL